MSRLLLVPENVPAELRAYDQWVGWRWVRANGDWTKHPVSPNTQPPDLADITDPADWSSFDIALAYARDHRLAGLGFVLTADDPFAIIDLDDAVNPDTRKIIPAMRGIVTRLRSYTETSPSGSGVHVIVQGTLPPGRRRHRSVEMYDRDRYVTITGWYRPDTPASVEPRQVELESMYQRHIARPIAKELAAARPRRRRRSTAADLATMTFTPGSDPDDVVLRKALGAKNGYKFRRLYVDGDTTGYPSKSEADLALCGLLAYWTNGSAEQIDRLFTLSALADAKWERQDYRDRTIGQALTSRLTSS